MNRPNKTEYVILGLLGIEPMSGYDIKAVISESLDFFWAASYGQIYPTLKSLHHDGYVSKKVEAGDGKPSRHVYEITMQGRRKLKDWLVAELEPEPVRNELLLKLFFSGKAERAASAKHVASFCRQQEHRLKTFLEIEKTIIKATEGDSSHPFFSSTVRYGIHLTRARIRWCKETLSLLKDE